MITSMPRRPKSRRSDRRNLRLVASPKPFPTVENNIVETDVNDIENENNIENGGGSVHAKSAEVQLTSLTVVPGTGGNKNLKTGKIGKKVSPRPRKSSKPKSWWHKSLLSCVRVGILGVGLGAIAGTAITTLSPTKFIRGDQDQKMAVGATGEEKSVEKEVIYPQQLLASLAGWVATETEKLRGAPATGTDQGQQEQKEDNSAVTTAVPSNQTNKVVPTTEDQALKGKLTALAATKAPTIVPYAYFIDVDNGQFVSVKGETKLPAASTIKIPVAIAFFEAVDQGKIQLNEEIPLTEDVIVGEAGTIQYEVGKRDRYSALEVVTKMIVISDNTATNMLIKRLGGKDALNQRFKSWQMSQTQINNYLPDLEGTNTTSPQDLASLLVKLQSGELLSLKSRDRLLNIMQETKTRTLLPQGLEPGAQISHKTGDIGKILGDAGVIDMTNGKRYVGAVLATRPHNDVAGRTLIQDISRTVYQHYKGITPPAPKKPE